MSQIKYIAYRNGTSASDGGEQLVLDRFPVIHRKDASLWKEGCAYLATRAVAIRLREIDIQTLHSEAKHLSAFLTYCESKNLEPLRLPPLRAEKPTYRFRAYLIQQRNSRQLASSTASARINAIKRFYSWLLETGLLDASSLPFITRNAHIQTLDRYGYNRKVVAKSSDLAIRARSIGRSTLEGGLHPVSREVRDAMIADAYKHSSQEFALMLDLGFRSGMRLESICLLTTTAIDKAYTDERGSHYYIRLGPRSGVPTKLDVEYSAQIPKDLFERIRDYADSVARAKRLSRADVTHQNLIFLTRFGSPFYKAGGIGSPTVSAQLSRLKARLKLKELEHFYFHCTRATFGTSIVMAGLNANEPVRRIVKRLMDLMGHAHISSSLKYISYVEQLNTNAAIDLESSV